VLCGMALTTASIMCERLSSLRVMVMFMAFFIGRACPAVTSFPIF
jgi:hypothetical protein